VAGDAGAPWGGMVGAAGDAMLWGDSSHMEGMALEAVDEQSKG